MPVYCCDHFIFQRFGSDCFHKDKSGLDCILVRRGLLVLFYCGTQLVQ
jgi:hypothetical protein